MRIINQNHDKSFNFDNMTIFIDGTSICTTQNKKLLVLGEYESVKRVQEVFVDIHSTYLPLANAAYIMPSK